VLRTQTGFYAGAVSFSEQVAVYKCLARHSPALDRELQGLTVLAVQGGNLPGIVTRVRPVTSLKDLTGLRLRAPAELMGLLESLGADPVNMPMGSVYSSLARGVIDGVVAPLDTLRSLHLAEVAQHYTSLAVPRGAYPARAIRTQRLAQLPHALAALLRASADVWEAALAHELAQAQHGGEAYARERGISLHPLADSEQQAFDRAYNASARERAQELRQRGIDGEALFAAARGWVAQLRSPAPPAAHVSALCPDGHPLSMATQ
jgi:TRAP-type C4-dicarboxylate transport system substrate-binding protein